MAPNPTRRRLILAAIVARLSTITIANGYATDAGAQAPFIGEAPEMGKDDPDVALAVIVGDEAATVPGQRLSTSVDLPIEVQMLAKAELDHAWLTIEDGLGDIKRALELEDRTLGRVTGYGALARTFERGTVRTLPREPGSTAVGAGATYVVSYGEQWGAP